MGSGGIDNQVALRQQMEQMQAMQVRPGLNIWCHLANPRLEVAQLAGSDARQVFASCE